jgi:hypothetical protein
MTLSLTRLSLTGLAGLILCLGCASAPAPAKPEPAASPAASAAPPPLPRVSLICHDGTTAARFAELGVPQGEFPEAAAISGDLTYVLFRPGRLLRITRKEGKIQAEMALSKPGETWANLDVDPVDGSLWLVSEQDLALRKITPDWKTKTVKLQNVQGSGGFSRVLAAPDALYVTPSCAEKAVWRISRDGKVLGTEFSASPPPNPGAEPVNPDALNCSSVRLERDGAGRILAWDRKKKTLHRVDSEGKWTPVEEVSVQGLDEPFQETSVVKGIDVGGKGEQWYVRRGPLSFFYWKGSPIFLGPATSNQAGRNDTLFLVPKAGGIREMVETCYGASIQGIATSPDRYAAYTYNAIVFGDFAGAPDLP